MFKSDPSPPKGTVLHLQFHISFHRRWAVLAATFLAAINYAKNGKRLDFVSKQRLAGGLFFFWHLFLLTFWPTLQATQRVILGDFLSSSHQLI